jgi:hypothetical protein
VRYHLTVAGLGLILIASPASADPSAESTTPSVQVTIPSQDPTTAAPTTAAPSTPATSAATTKPSDRTEPAYTTPAHTHAPQTSRATDPAPAKTTAAAIRTTAAVTRTTAAATPAAPSRRRIAAAEHNVPATIPKPSSAPTTAVVQDLGNAAPQSRPSTATVIGYILLSGLGLAIIVVLAGMGYLYFRSRGAHHLH